MTPPKSARLPLAALVAPALVLVALLAAAAIRSRTATGEDGPPVAEPVIRRAVLAGTWYPADRDELRQAVTGYLEAAATPRPAGTVRALVAPHAGYRWSGATAGRAYATVRGGPYRRVLLLAPSHRVAFRGISVPEVDAYETPLGRVPLDLEARATLLAAPGFRTVPEAHEDEHAVEVQLPFLQVALGSFTLVPCVVGAHGRESDARLADALRPLLDDRTLLVASSDFTHQGERFGYRPFEGDVKENLRRLDLGIVETILARDVDAFRKRIDETGATVCGRRPIGLLLRLLPEGARGTLLGYATSADATGDFSSSVSYVAMAFATPPAGLDAEERATLLRLARDTLRRGVAREGRPDLADYPITARLRRPCGVFVTLRKEGRLRGCIGYLTGRRTLAEGVVDNALNAAFRDPRFPRLRADELDDLSVEISAMTPLRRLGDPLHEAVVGRHGLVLEKDGHRGVFLPQVPVEQGWDLRTYLRELCGKAGLADPEAWRAPDAVLWSFEAQVFSEDHVPEER